MCIWIIWLYVCTSILYGLYACTRTVHTYIWQYNLIWYLLCPVKKSVKLRRLSRIRLAWEWYDICVIDRTGFLMGSVSYIHCMLHMTYNTTYYILKKIIYVCVIYYVHTLSCIPNLFCVFMYYTLLFTLYQSVIL
jgi:hypothetical protein